MRRACRHGWPRLSGRAVGVVGDDGARVVGAMIGMEGDMENQNADVKLLLESTSTCPKVT